jgi:hypothetical protein
MAEPKTKKAPETDAPEMPEAEKAPEAAPVNERSYADRMERELRLPRGGEAAVVVSALLDLHRTVGAGAAGATIRGRKSEQSNRYLEAARRVGDQLVNDLLGPAEGATR